jgi:acetyl esterase/lipase
MNSRRLFGALCFALSAATLSAQTIPLWPHGAPDPQPATGAEHDMSKRTDADHNPQITDISVPTMTVYKPARPNGTGILVFPGGGYHFLNMKAAGTEPCEWVNSVGATCFLVKYRVPLVGYYPQQKAMLEDGQQAVRLVRAHAAGFGVDPNHIGIMGFSAGGNLVLLLNTHPDDPRVMSTKAAQDVPLANGQPVDARSDFTFACWPAYVTVKPEETKLDPTYTPNKFTPPTFLLQAENDPMFHPNAIVYFNALMAAKIPAELHYYATGGHAFGMSPGRYSQARWPDLAANFLRFNKFIPGYVEPTNTADPRAVVKTVLDLWPHGVPDPTDIPPQESDRGKPGPDHKIQLDNVSVPKLYIYPPAPGVKNTGAGIVVFPGGGYAFLQWSHAGTEACDYATSIGITCFLARYRVPSHGEPPANPIPLDDGQQAMRLARAHAAEYGVDPHRIGAMGFSAGGNLTVMLGTHADDPHVLSTPAAKDVPREDNQPGGKPVSARPDFLVDCWPGLILEKPAETALEPYYKPNNKVPPSFIIQAEDDPAVGRSSLVLFRAYMDAGVPAELHIFQSGKHAFGMHPDKFDQAHWDELLTNWLKFNKFIPGWLAPAGHEAADPEAALGNK